MARLSVPVIATVIGEGGSGGALALAVADRVLMLENSTYSVITPGGLRRHPLARRRLCSAGRRGARPTASHLLELGVIERVVAEPRGGAHHNPEDAAARFGEAIAETLAELDADRSAGAPAPASRALSAGWAAGPTPELPPGYPSLFVGPRRPRDPSGTARE